MPHEDASMVDVAFALAGDALPRDHRRLLADALERALPWLARQPDAGVHRIKVVPGGDGRALLPRRARLMLRVKREQVPSLDALAGAELDLGGHRLRLGPPVLRELLPHATLYADFVVAADGDELRFLSAVQSELDELGVSCRRICGRAQVVRSGEASIAGFSLMLDALSPGDSLRVLEAGLGSHRHWGFGLFVPHRSAAAVRA